MYIIIVGGGLVGRNLSGELIRQGHEVLVIERSSGRCERLREELGSVVMRGDGCEVATLGSAGAERADVFIAVTEGDEDNLVACQVARHRFHVRHIIARINDQRNERLFKLLGISHTVGVVELITNGILAEMPEQQVTRLTALNGSGMELMGFRVPKTAHAIGKRLGDIRLPSGAAVSVIVHGPDRRPEVPGPDLTIQPEDELIVLARPDDEAALIQALTR